MHLLYFYVPADHAESVKEALFSAGAGKFKNYDKCAFQTSGTGQFRPLRGANPFIGSINKIEFVEEIKVEMICEDEDIETLKKVLVSAHPYEEPAFGFFQIFS